MGKMIHVLIFPAGEINSVELHDALSVSVNVKVFGASSVERHGSYIFENYIPDLPFVNAPEFIEVFNKLLDEHQIDIVFPTHDSVATFFADNSEKIRAKIATTDKRTADICRDKKLTYSLFSGEDFIPQVYANHENLFFPVFVKPRIGQGSVGARMVESGDEIKADDWEKSVVSEYLSGEEYTVDCLTDRHGKLRVISPRSRDRTLAGVSVASRSQPLTAEISEIAEKINSKLSFSGLWFFQIKKDSKGRFKLLEVSIRCAGTMCLTRVRGANLPLLSVYVLMGYDIEPIMNEYEITLDRTLINRYKVDYSYKKVYLDFDDTVIIRGKVHLPVVMFIYQCRNNGIPIHLITKHADNIHTTLNAFGLDLSLFQSVIHLGNDEQKTDNINPEGAIFIDNSFQERKYIHDEYKIPVFDVDAVESLLDWRN